MKKYIGFIILMGILFLLEMALGISWLITREKELMYFLGFTTGLLFSYLISMILCITLKKKFFAKGQFDERQLKSRGDCYCVSFFVLLICLFLDGMMRQILEWEWSSYFVGCFTWGMVSISVFAIMAIWKDAYMSAGQSKLRLGIVLLCIGIFNIVICVINCFKSGLLEGNQLGVNFINLFGGIMLGIISLNLFIKLKIDRRIKEEDEEFKTEVC